MTIIGYLVSIKAYLVRWWSRDRCSGRLRWYFQADECDSGTLHQQSHTSTHADIPSSVDWSSFISDNIAIQCYSTSNDRNGTKKWKANLTKTKGSAFVEGPRDALCHLSTKVFQTKACSMSFVLK